MGSYFVFRTRYSLLYREQHLRTDVCQNGRSQWRYGVIYQSAVFTLDHQTFLEPVCRYHQNQKMVGCLHADSDVDSFYLADVDHTAAG